MLVNYSKEIVISKNHTGNNQVKVWDKLMGLNGVRRGVHLFGSDFCLFLARWPIKHLNLNKRPCLPAAPPCINFSARVRFVRLFQLVARTVVDPGAYKSPSYMVTRLSFRRGQLQGYWNTLFFLTLALTQSSFPFASPSLFLPVQMERREQSIRSK